MVLRRPGHDPKPDLPSTNPVLKPDKPPKGGTTPALISPTGKVSGAPANNGVDWSQVNQYDPSYALWGGRAGIDPNYCKRMTVVESGGVNIQGGQAGSTGILQIMPLYWYDTAKMLGVSLYTPDGQIAVCNWILSGKSGHGDFGGPEQNFRRLYFPHDDPLSGVTQDAYWQWIAGTTPAPQPEKQGDVLDLVFGGKPYAISSQYGQEVTWECPQGVVGGPNSCYAYFAAYGLDSYHHWAYDVSADAGEGAPLFAPFDGTITCAGTSLAAAGSWGTSCAAFPHVDNYGGASDGRGAGRLEILHRDGTRSLILGHVLTSLVAVGQRVKAGDKIGKQGGMNASHVHIEARYANGARIGDPRKVFPESGTLPEMFDTVDYDLWASNGNVYRVTTTQAVPAYQRADPQAAKLGVLEKGTAVEAVARIVGQDAAEWWLLADKRRLPTTGTTFTTVVK